MHAAARAMYEAQTQLLTSFLNHIDVIDLAYFLLLVYLYLLTHETGFVNTQRIALETDLRTVYTLNLPCRSLKGISTYRESRYPGNCLYGTAVLLPSRAWFPVLHGTSYP
jgi:hypothetical protein